MPIYFQEDPDKPFVPARTRSRASLIVLSADLSPSEITELIGIPPDEAHTKGAPQTPQSSYGWKYHSWQVHSRSHEMTPPEDHLASLLERVEPFAERIAALARSGQVEPLRVWISHHIENYNPGLSIDPGLLARVAQLGASLDLDIYAEEFDDDEANGAGVQ
jgi:uncharacterized protein DUF4279